MGSQSDLDQGGTIRQWVRSYLGASVGWIEAPLQNILSITTAGTYALDPSTSLVEVNVAVGAVTIILPKVVNPPAGPQVQPRLFADNPIIVIDIGGNALANNIVIQRNNSGESIMGLASVKINQNYAGFIFQPVPANATWDNIPLGTNTGAGSAGAVYYISAAGSDTNTGLSPSSAWQTIAKVNAQTPVSGTSFLFRGGDTFSGTITVAAGGLPGFPIVYSSYGDAVATISSANAGGFTCTDFGNITVNRLNFNGSGVGTNTAHAINFIGSARNNSGYTITNCTITNYGLTGVYFTVSSGIVLDTINIANNTIHDCGMNGVTLYNNYLVSFPNFINYSNVTVSNNLIYNITGQNTPVIPQGNFTGWGIIANGVDGFTVQGNTIHDCGSVVGVNAGNNMGAGIGTALNSNVLVQNNEIYHQITQGGGSHDASGIIADFGSTNTTVQYNFIHDCGSYAFGVGSANNAGNLYNNSNTVFRYNVCLNNGTDALSTVTLPGGIAIFNLSASEQITGLKIYNNIISGQGNTITGVGLALFDDSYGFSGYNQGIVTNNIFVGDANTILLSYHNDTIRFIGNQYVGGSTVTKIRYKNTSYASIAAWITATIGTVTSQETIDGAAVLITAPDPLFVGTYPLQALQGSTSVAGQSAARAANAQLSPISPVAKAGVDLTQLTQLQIMGVPLVTFSAVNSAVFSGVDFDFRGGVYSGGTIGNLTCSRAATSGSDLLYTDPMGRTPTTFGANALRITANRGLLVEEARTQFLANPTAPATQTTGSISINTLLILWVNGPGSAVLSSGTGTVVAVSGTIQPAVHGRPAFYKMNSTGNVVCTVTGTLNQFQLENDPTGNGVPTSLITAAGTRDADVVTATGGAIQTFCLDIMRGGNTQVESAVVTFKIPYNTFANSAYTGNLIGADTNASYLGVEFIINTAQNPQYDCVFTVAGATLTRTATTVQQQKRQAVGVITDKVNGQTLLVNGGAAVTNAAHNNPTIATAYIGNQQNGSQALNGYIERMTFQAAPTFTVADLQSNTSMTPMASDLVHDFWGNPVPNAGGGYSIGPHQPVATTGGATFTANGATPVTVNDVTVTANSTIIFTLKTVGGSVGAYPAVQTITPGTGFTVKATAADTSVYNYMIFG